MPVSMMIPPIMVMVVGVWLIQGMVYASSVDPTGSPSRITDASEALMYLSVQL